ncbi:hypothetical protein WME97_41745 [Sorangium sp. So ce367]|uniref:hypothetical protein n=1 Tax=Sorangium sp. So ce367 TaxID=3133305 RepID=UPI003F606E03
MMSRLGDEIRRQQGQRESKDVLRAYIEELASADEPKFSTLETKFSKLLNGDPEGERYFLDTPGRCAALERALAVPAGWMERERHVRVLILDPALDDSVREYLRGREEVAGAGRFACREVPVDGDPRRAPREVVLDAIRQIAESEPRYLVVAASNGVNDRMYFTGAKIAWSTVTKSPRGFLLESVPDLVPMPEPDPPCRFDRLGEPMMPDDVFERAVREELAREEHRSGFSRWGRPDCRAPGGCLFRDRDDYEALKTLIEEADARERRPSFPVHRLLPVLSARAGLGWAITASCARRNGVLDPDWDLRYSSEENPVVWSGRGGASGGVLAELAKKILFDQSRATLCWTHGERILGIGPNVGAVRGLLAPYHEVFEPAVFARWKTASEQWNPWRVEQRSEQSVTRSEPWRQLCEAISQETGISIEGTVAGWQQAMARQWAGPCWPFRLASPEEAARAHEVLSELASRAWQSDEPTRPLLLDAASRARLVILAGHGEAGTVHVLADLGAGHVLRVLLLRFPSEEPQVIDELRGGALDGGDVHGWLETKYERLLEGSALPARARRRREDDDD